MTGTSGGGRGGRDKGSLGARGQPGNWWEERYEEGPFLPRDHSLLLLQELRGSLQLVGSVHLSYVSTWITVCLLRSRPFLMG